MTNLHTVSVALFVASFLLFAVSIYILISCISIRCNEKKKIGWFAFGLSCAVLVVNLFIVVPHYEKKQSKINYCNSVSIGTKQYYLDCASTSLLCQSYEDGTLVKTAQYCERCVSHTMGHRTEEDDYVSIPNTIYVNCIAKFQTFN
jgi:hypothetical protein